MVIKGDVRDIQLKSKSITMFLSRLPATYKECSRAIQKAVNAEDWIELGSLNETTPPQKRPAAVYRAYETTVRLYDRDYRGIVVHSSAQINGDISALTACWLKSVKTLIHYAKRYDRHPIFAELTPKLHQTSCIPPQSAVTTSLTVPSKRSPNLVADGRQKANRARLQAMSINYI